MRLRSLQIGIFALLVAAWYLLTAPNLIPAFYFEQDNRAAFFFGEPQKVFAVILDWFMTGEIFVHLGVTLLETLLGFVIGAVFGLGIWSKVALGVTLVFFVVFFNVYQGVRKVSPTLIANARMLGATQRQLLRAIYLPSAMSWVFASLHNAVGLAFVGAVVGEYLGSAQGVGYLILQAEGTFDINTVFAGIVVLTAFALVLDAAVGAVEGRLMTWQPRTSETEKV